MPRKCTSELQPLNVSVNVAIQSFKKVKFTEWNAEKVAKACQDHGSDIKAAAAAEHPNLHLSVLKPPHTHRFMDCMANLRSKVKVIVRRWAEPGILAGVENTHSKQPMESKPELQPGPFHSLDLHNQQWHDGCVAEHFLLDNICKSRLDGQNGSISCTVIAHLLDSANPQW